MSYLREYFPDSHLSACDISGESIKIAKENFPYATYHHTETVESFNDKVDNYDLCLMACVLHHVPVEERDVWIEAVVSKINQGGAIAIFEHNPKNPITRHTVDRCPFDAGVTLLTLKECCELLEKAGLECFYKKYTLMFPWRNRVFEFIENIFSSLPFGTQFCVMAKRKV